MNNYEIMNQRVDQLRLQLAELHKFELQNKRLKEDIMAELLDTRRQITQVDKLKQEFGYFIEGSSPTFKKDAMIRMVQLSSSISDIKWLDGNNFQSVSWMGIPKELTHENREDLPKIVPTTQDPPMI